MEGVGCAKCTVHCVVYFRRQELLADVGTGGLDCDVGGVDSHPEDDDLGDVVSDLMVDRIASPAAPAVEILGVPGDEPPDALDLPGPPAPPPPPAGVSFCKSSFGDLVVPTVA